MGIFSLPLLMRRGEPQAPLLLPFYFYFFLKKFFVRESWEVSCRPAKPFLASAREGSASKTWRVLGNLSERTLAR
jgi:hypothetical protein